MARGLNNSDKCIILDEPTLKFLSSLKSLRKAANKTLIEVAAQLNTTFYSVYDWEKGRCYPCLKRLIQLAEFYQYDISDSLNYKYFHKIIQPNRIQNAIRRYGLDYQEIAQITGYCSYQISASVNMKKKYGSVTCLAAVLNVIEHERELCNFRKELIHGRK